MNMPRLLLFSIAGFALSAGAASALAQQGHAAPMSGVVAYASIGNDHSQHMHGQIVAARTVAVVRRGKIFGHSAVQRFNAQFDVNGQSIDTLHGRPVRDEMLGHATVDKQRAWGTEPSPASCHGEWEFDRFAVDTINSDADLATCVHHHVPGPGDELSGAGHRHREIE